MPIVLSAPAAWEASLVQTRSFGDQPVRDIYFKSDGLKMFFVIPETPSGTRLRATDLTVAWDISTWSEIASTTISGSPPSMHGGTFKSDGTRYYQVDSGIPDRVRQFDLSPAWDVTSRSEVGNVTVPNAGQAVRFSPDGTKMIFKYGTSVIGYDLSVAWDVTTAVADGNGSFSFGAVNTGYGFYVNPTGTRLLNGERDAALVNRYVLTTPWDVSTMVLLDSLDLSSDTDKVHAVILDTSETRMFIVGEPGSAATMLQFDIAN